MKILQGDGKWKLLEKHTTLLLMDERTLDRIVEDPAQPLMPELEKGFSGEKHRIYDDKTSLLDVCRRGQEEGARRLEVSYDFFFGGSVRTNYPDSPATVKAYQVIHETAKQHGMGFSASVVSPLDVGGGFARQNENTEQVWQYKECALDADGAFETEMVLQTQWTNNKGPIALKLLEVRAYAFDEERLGDTPYYYVDEDAIQDISEGVCHAVDPDSIEVSPGGYGRGRLRVWGNAPGCGKGRCLAVAVYATPEVDYFDPGAEAYMKSVIDLHHGKGITYAGFYSDEMHIQFDWDLNNHFGLDSEINARHMTGSLASEYARRYGPQYADMGKYLVYFAYHQHGFMEGEEGKLPAQHVMGRDAAGLYRTFLFRKRYFEMLQRRVVDLCLATKDYAESLFGGPIMTRAHSTWQEAPTCDRFFDKQRFSEEPGRKATRYDYTPDYVWSSSIRENISACYDYFKWNEYLTGGGTDHPEGGFLDRNYYGSAFVCSLGLLNKFPFSYYGYWGSPRPVMKRLADVGVTYGNQALGYDLDHNIVQGLSPRISEVLTLYPLDLNYVEERFGSWMVQYGYTDYITEEQLAAHFRGASGGRLSVGSRRYGTLMVFYNPLTSEKTLDIVQDFLEAGGRVIWCSAPALGEEGEPHPLWRQLFGIRAGNYPLGGRAAPGGQVTFSGTLSGIGAMDIPTDMRPDFTYCVQPNPGTQVVAELEGETLGTLHRTPSGGVALYLGFRPRDDQSGSQGRDISTLFDILMALGCYDPQGPEAQSRPADSRYIHNRFVNGAVSIANHMRAIEEDWYGTFFRDEEEDAKILQNVTLTPEEIQLEGRMLQGRQITYRGRSALTYRIDEGGNLDGFAGRDTTGITIDGRTHTFSQTPVDLCWTRLSARELQAPVADAYLVRCGQLATLTLPIDGRGMACALYDMNTHQAGEAVAFTPDQGGISLVIGPREAGQWLVLYRKS